MKEVHAFVDWLLRFRNSNYFQSSNSDFYQTCISHKMILDSVDMYIGFKIITSCSACFLWFCKDVGLELVLFKNFIVTFHSHWSGKIFPKTVSFVKQVSNTLNYYPYYILLKKSAM